jgi:hypothetical protein
MMLREFKVTQIADGMQHTLVAHNIISVGLWICQQ